MNAYRHKPRLTIAELRPILEFYNATLRGWRVIRDDTLVREAGPVLQGITFERLSGGEYRPTGHIRVLVAPRDFWAMELDQVLNLSVRQISRRQNPEFRDRVIDAIHAEFLPNVDTPLTAMEVLELYERGANPPRSSDAYSLAALNAYLGRDEHALYWCLYFTELVNVTGYPWQELDCKQRAFLDDLEGWLKSGRAKHELERVLQEERRKWGLV